MIIDVIEQKTWNRYKSARYHFLVTYNTIYQSTERIFWQKFALDWLKYVKAQKSYICIKIHILFSIIFCYFHVEHKLILKKSYGDVWEFIVQSISSTNAAWILAISNNVSRSAVSKFTPNLFVLTGNIITVSLSFWRWFLLLFILIVPYFPVAYIANLRPTIFS